MLLDAGDLSFTVLVKYANTHNIKLVIQALVERGYRSPFKQSLYRQRLNRLHYSKIALRYRVQSVVSVSRFTEICVDRYVLYAIFGLELLDLQIVTLSSSKVILAEPSALRILGINVFIKKSEPVARILTTSSSIT